MQRDQAAGLRRRASPTPCCIHCLSSAAATAVRMDAALHQCGWRVLRVEAAEHRPTPIAARSLFDWRQQLARGQLNVLPMAHGDVWLAPGLQADVPEFAVVAARYDAVLLDCDFVRDTWAPMPGAGNHVVIDALDESHALQQAFRLIKTLHRHHPGCGVSLVGDALACRHLQEAAGRFLDIAFARTLSSLAEEVEPFVALAARMAGEEKGRSARC